MKKTILTAILLTVATLTFGQNQCIVHTTYSLERAQEDQLLRVEELSNMGYNIIPVDYRLAETLIAKSNQMTAEEITLMNDIPGNYVTVITLIEVGVFASQSRSVERAAGLADVKVGVFASQSRSVERAANAADNKVGIYQYALIQSSDINDQSTTMTIIMMRVKN